MSEGNARNISLASSPEAISIAVPLSAQLATIKRNKDLMEQASGTRNSEDSQKKSLLKMPKDKSKGCPFPTCSRYGHAFSRAHDLKRHIARHEKRKERLSEGQDPEVCKCTECGQILVSDVGLEQHLHMHLKQSRAGPQIYTCQICKKKYINENKLKVHMLTHVKKTKENTCALCNARFVHEEDYENHLKEHTASILHAQNALQNSSMNHDLGDDEDDNFLLEEMLLFKKDSRILTDKMPGLPKDKRASIRCHYCFKTFKTKWTLNCHVAAHEGRFQYDCRKCGKKFVRKSHYEGHLRSHEPARPYTCELCGKRFKELKHRREHSKRKHPEANVDGVQSLVDDVSEQSTSDQAKFAILMPVNFPM